MSTTSAAIAARRRDGREPVRAIRTPQGRADEKPGLLHRPIATLEIGGRIRPKDLVVLTRQLSTMIDAGLPLVQCLQILSRQAKVPALSAVLDRVRHDVESGQTFAEALARHPKVFDELFVSLVEAGEIGGVLDTILNRLASFIEKAQKLRRQLKGAMIYPASIVTVAIAVTTVILYFVIPTFERLFSGLGSRLPLPTQIVIAMSAFVQEYALLLLAGGAMLALGARALYRSPAGRRVIDDAILSVPVLGDVVRKACVARFSRTLATMISSGVPILESLGITARTAGNRTLERAILEVRQGIAEGRSIAEPLEATRVFPEMVVEMIAVGEATGSIDTMLAKIADFYEDEVDGAVRALMALLEPLLMIVLGITVGGLIIAMYLPIFSIVGTF